MDSGHVLLVEDDRDLRELIARHLGRLGYRVSQTGTLRECLDGMRRGAEPPDLIIADRFLPDGDGADILRRSREDPELHKVPVVFISVDRQPESVSRLLAAGAKDYLAKPFDARELTGRVAAAIRESRQKQTLLRTQQFLARIKRELELVFDGVSMPVLLIDRELTVRRINRAGMRLGRLVAFEQALGGKCFRVLYGADRPCQGCPAAEAFAAGQSRERELEHRLRGGQAWHRHWVGPLGGGQGGQETSEERALELVEDLTGRHSAEEERLRSGRLQAVMRMAGGLAHEISQPLAAVCGRAELLEMHLTGAAGTSPDPAEALRHLECLRSSARRISEIVRRLQNVNEFVTKPYYGSTEIVDLDQSAPPLAAEEPPDYIRPAAGPEAPRRDGTDAAAPQA